MEALDVSVLQLLAEACAEAKQAFAQHIGMSPARFQLLALLAQHGETSHAALQQQTGLDGATITRLVKQYESEGLVSRRVDPQDNRYTLASLTASGEQIVAGFNMAHQTFQASLLDGITPEEQEVVALILTRLRTNIAHIRELS